MDEDLPQMEFQDDIANSFALNIQKQLENLTIDSGNHQDSTVALLSSYPTGASVFNSDQPAAAGIAKNNVQVSSQLEQFDLKILGDSRQDSSNHEAKLLKMNENLIEAQRHYFQLMKDRDLARQKQLDCSTSTYQFKNEIEKLEQQILNSRAHYCQLAKARNSAVDKAKEGLNHNLSSTQSDTFKSILRLSRSICKKKIIPGCRGRIEKSSLTREQFYQSRRE